MQIDFRGRLPTDHRPFGQEPDLGAELGHLTAVSGAATSAISSMTSTSPEACTLSRATSSQVTQWAVSQPGKGLPVCP